MIKKGMAAAATVAAGALMLFAATASGQEGPPPTPTAGEQVVDGLLQPRGSVVGPDGLIYIAEAGTGGDDEFEAPDGTVLQNGLTGRISSVDPATGTRTTVADSLPSSVGAQGEAIGPADVAFIGDQLYYVHSHGGDAWGFPDHPTGVYEVADDGSVDLVADIYQFNVDNPVEAIGSGAQPDVEIGGNPYSMMTRDGMFYVVDGNHNRLMEITTGGDVSEVVEFPDHPVSTGIDAEETGPFYVTYLGPGPFLPEDGKLVQVSPTGTITELAAGLAMLTDVEIGPGDDLYVLQFGNGFVPGTGTIALVNDDGTFSPIVTGFTFASSLEFIGDTAYVLNDSVNALGTGSLWAVENFSTIPPIQPTPVATATTAAPAATATRATGVTAPDTGTGPSGNDGSMLLALAVAMGAAAFAAGAGALAFKRR